jgi:hypothetical protein
MNLIALELNSSMVNKKPTDEGYYVCTVITLDEYVINVKCASDLSKGTQITVHAVGDGNKDLTDDFVKLYNHAMKLYNFTKGDCVETFTDSEHLLFIMQTIKSL